jgi:hypothetical protein
MIHRQNSFVSMTVLQYPYSINNIKKVPLNCLVSSVQPADAASYISRRHFLLVRTSSFMFFFVGKVLCGSWILGYLEFVPVVDPNFVNL